MSDADGGSGEAGNEYSASGLVGGARGLGLVDAFLLTVRRFTAGLYA